MTTETPAKLPVWETALECYRLTFRHLGELLRFAWPWLLVLVAVSGALYWGLYPAEQAAKDSGGSTALWLSALVFSTAIGAFIAVPWHRLLLLGEKQDGNANAILDRRSWSYLANAALLVIAPALLLLALIMLFPDTPESDDSELDLSGLVAALGFTLFLICYSLLITRLSLVLPAIAVDHGDTGWRGAWQMSRNNTWRLFWDFVLVTIPFFIPLFIVMILPPEAANELGVGNAQSRMIFTTHGVVAELAAMLFGMLFVTLLSLAYRHFTGLPAPQSAPDSNNVTPAAP